MTPLLTTILILYFSEGGALVSLRGKMSTYGQFYKCTGVTEEMKKTQHMTKKENTKVNQTIALEYQYDGVWCKLAVERLDTFKIA